MIIFLHIPRTSGRSIKLWLRDNYPKKKLIWDDKDILSIDKKINKEVNIAFGHFWYGFHKLCQDNYKYVTIVRNPIERVISTYYVIKNSSPKYDSVWKGLPLKEWVLKNFGFGVDNLQTRMLVARLAPKGLKNWWIPGVNTWLTPYIKLDDRYYNDAIKHINKDFSFVGMYEKRDYSIRKIAKIMNVNEFDLLGNSRVSDVASKGRLILDDIDSEVIDILNNRECYDLKLYDYIRSNFS